MPLILNLSRYTPLSKADREAIREIEQFPLKRARARTEIIREGENPDVVRLVVSGWACRFKDLPDGRRQIVGFFIPGDFCDLNTYILSEMDHTIGALTDVAYLAIPPEQLQLLVDKRPRVAQALLWQELVSSSIQREWLLNLGKRTSLERLAHLFVELYTRCHLVGLADENICDFSLTQSDLADASGITAVHLNRTLQDLRGEGLVELRGKRLKILDMDRLQQIAMFNPNYLHLESEGGQQDGND